MRKERYNLWKEREYTHPNTFGFMPNIVSYLHETKEYLPCILLVPGGGYASVSPSEGEIVAKKFYEQGYHAFVLSYTVNRLMGTPVKMQALRDISRAIRFIRKHVEEFYVDCEKIIVCGFSAGGHLAASLCVHFEDVEDQEYGAYSNRPDAAILSYPVITSGEFAHQDSLRCLLGREIYEQVETTYEGISGCETRRDVLEYMSLEKHVTEKTPPCFLWHTVTDALVPMENSLLFAQSLKKREIPFAYHLFSSGEHGLSLASKEWGKGQFGGEYTHEQIHRLVKEIESGEIELSKEDRLEYEAYCEHEKQKAEHWIENPGNKEVEQWFHLAINWLKERVL